MAAGRRVEVSNTAIITALNTPGGAVRNWSEVTGRKIKMQAIEN